VVALPAMDREALRQTEDMIARSARLELHAVASATPFMAIVGERAVHDARAAAAGISVGTDSWAGDDGAHADVFLHARDGRTTGRVAIERYLAELASTEPRFAVPAGKRLAYEHLPDGDWRSYVVDRESALTSAAVMTARVSRAPVTDALELTIELDPAATRTFAEMTTANVGKKIAFLLEDQVENAPIVTGPITGGRVTITFARRRAPSGDPALDRRLDERDADDLAIALEAGALPSMLREVTTRAF
jgi:preprotein translocase subunit SecD